MTRAWVLLGFFAAVVFAACPRPQTQLELTGPPIALVCPNKNKLVALSLPLVPVRQPASEECLACRASHCAELTGQFLVEPDSGFGFRGVCGPDFSCQCGLVTLGLDERPCSPTSFTQDCQVQLNTYDACLRRECRALCPLELTTGYEPDASVFDGGPVYLSCTDPQPGVLKPCCTALATCCQAIPDAGAREQCLGTVMGNEGACRTTIPSWGDHCPTAAPGFDGGPALARCDARGADGGRYLGCCTDFSGCCAATSDPLQRAACQDALASAGGNDQLCRFRLPPFTAGCP